MYRSLYYTVSRVSEVETEVTTLDSQVSTLAPTVSVNEDVTPPTITIGVNGKTATANLPSGGGEISVEIVESDTLVNIFKNHVLQYEIGASVGISGNGNIRSFAGVTTNWTDEDDDEHWGIMGFGVNFYAASASGSIAYLDYLAVREETSAKIIVTSGSFPTYQNSSYGTSGTYRAVIIGKKLG